MQNNNWNEKYTGACKICGPGIPRMRSWTGANYKNPLREFLEWVIFGLDNKRTGRTIAISHYGGFVLKYFLILIFLDAMICIYFWVS